MCAPMVEPSDNFTKPGRVPMMEQASRPAIIVEIIPRPAFPRMVDSATARLSLNVCLCSKKDTPAGGVRVKVTAGPWLLASMMAIRVLVISLFIALTRSVATSSSAIRPNRRLKAYDCSTFVFV